MACGQRMALTVTLKTVGRFSPAIAKPRAKHAPVLRAQIAERLAAVLLAGRGGTGGYVDPTAGKVLPDWDQALDAIGAEGDPPTAGC